MTPSSLSASAALLTPLRTAPTSPVKTVKALPPMANGNRTSIKSTGAAFTATSAATIEAAKRKGFDHANGFYIFNLGGCGQCREDTGMNIGQNKMAYHHFPERLPAPPPPLFVHC